MAEDPIAQGEAAALTRRYEQHAEQTNAALKVIKSDVLHLRLEVGANTARLDSVEAKIDAMHQEMSRNQAQIVELLSSLVGKNPDAS
ncbi:hypothetical protein ACFYWU_34370 [Streptomyces chrestomyceticus]|uniref:hypothetical protein n=1 Tax=Streptomyces chrestomyceticus TaxID=68185 RepID=UPI0036873B04